MLDPLSPLIGLVNTVRSGVQDVRVTSERRDQLLQHCRELVKVLQEESNAFEDQRTVGEVQETLEKVCGQIDTWAKCSLLKSLFMQPQMSHELDRLDKDIAQHMAIHNARTGAELKRTLAETRDIMKCISQCLAGGQTLPVLPDMRKTAGAVPWRVESVNKEGTRVSNELHADLEKTSSPLKLLHGNSSVLRVGGLLRGKVPKPPLLDLLFLHVENDDDSFFRTADYTKYISPRSPSLTPSPPPLHQCANEQTPLEQALLSDNEYIETIGGQLIYGTFQGFITHFLAKSDETKSLQRDVFLLTYTAFTPPQALCDILVNRSKCSEKIKISVIKFIVCWLENQDAFIDHDTLTRIDEFVVAEGSSVDITLARRAADAVSQRRPSKPTPSTSPSHGLKTIDPKEVATALAVLGSQTYNSLLTSECITYIRNGQNSAWRPLHFYQTSNWVKFSILRLNDYEERAKMKKIFIKIAKECLAIHDFWSLAAILDALKSEYIRRLIATHDALSNKQKKVLPELQEMVARSDDYAHYREELARCRDRPCVPWLNRHLDDIAVEFRCEDFVSASPSDVGNGHLPEYLIDFSKWEALHDRAREIPRCCPDYNGNEAVVALLERRLHCMPVDTEFDRELAKKSEIFGSQELDMAERQRVQLDITGWGNR